MPVLSTDHGLRTTLWVGILLFALGMTPAAESAPFAAFMAMRTTAI